LLKEVPEPHKTRKKRDLFFKKNKSQILEDGSQAKLKKTHHNISLNHCGAWRVNHCETSCAAACWCSSAEFEN
jgi:hypothetical protein